MAVSNPNGANQFLLDPRQKLCWDYYVNPKSETFGNAYKSALKAGYEEASATHITAQDWFVEKRRRLNLLSKAEKVLDETLEYRPVSEDGKIDGTIARVVLDAAKFVASTQGKNEGYSTKVETDVTTGGQPLNADIEEKVAKAFNDYFTRHSTEGNNS